MMRTTQFKTNRQEKSNGFSLLELLIVIAVIAIVTALSVPQLVASRRLQRLSGIPFQVKTQLRMARQAAMSRRRAVTFQYDDNNKQMAVIVHSTVGTAVLTEPNYPNTNGSILLKTTFLTGSGINAPDITFGIPSAAPNGALDDGTSIALLPVNKQINITFQPDGSVLGANGEPESFALFFYNAALSNETAGAVSVLGAAGRVKVWRYNSVADKYVE